MPPIPHCWAAAVSMAPFIGRQAGGCGKNAGRWAVAAPVTPRSPAGMTSELVASSTPSALSGRAVELERRRSWPVVIDVALRLPAIGSSRRSHSLQSAREPMAIPYKRRHRSLQSRQETIWSAAATWTELCLPALARRYEKCIWRLLKTFSGQISFPPPYRAPPDRGRYPRRTRRRETCATGIRS